MTTRDKIKDWFNAAKEDNDAYDAKITHMIVMWRCTRCGKWSHAKQQPKIHQRFVRSIGPDDRVLATFPPVYGMYESDDDGGFTIACGPFEKWVATKEES